MVCNVSKSELNHHFPCKEVLLLVLTSEHISSAVGGLDAIAHGPGIPKERLKQFVRAMAKCAAEHYSVHMGSTNDLKFLPSLQPQEIKQVHACHWRQKFTPMRCRTPCTPSRRCANLP